MVKHAALVSRWDRWYERIEHELMGLATRRHVFETVRGILLATPKGDPSSEFHDLVSQGYGTYTWSWECAARAISRASETFHGDSCVVPATGIGSEVSTILRPLQETCTRGLLG